MDPLHPATPHIIPPTQQQRPALQVQPWAAHIATTHNISREEVLGLQRDFTQDTRTGHAKLIPWLERLRPYYLSVQAQRDLVRRTLGPRLRYLTVYYSPHSQAWHPRCGYDTPQRAEAARRAIGYAAEEDKALLVVNRVTDYPPYWTDEGLAALKLVHHPQYLETLQQPRDTEAPLYPGEQDSVLGPRSWDAMLMFAAMACNALHDIREGKTTRAFVAGRPPGHHAGIRGRTLHGGETIETGFCFTNTAAAVAKLATTKGFGRVLIIDIDVHHPNGTEEIVLADPDQNLALVSIHRHMEGEELVYPGTGGGESDGDRVLNLHNGGAKITEKFITTKAWPQVEAFAAHFHPHLIVVSAGFDASRDDIMAHGSLSSSFYATLAQMIVGLAEDHCGSRVIALQEGGYLALHPDHLPAEIPQDDDRLLRPLLSNIRHFIGGLT